MFLFGLVLVNDNNPVLNSVKIKFFMNSLPLCLTLKNKRLFFCCRLLKVNKLSPFASDFISILFLVLFSTENSRVGLDFRKVEQLLF